MNVISQSSYLKHTVVQDAKKKRVFVLLTSAITYRPEGSRVVTLNNDSELKYVVDYYRDANYKITLVVDSTMLPTGTANIMALNYWKFKLPVFDHATAVTYTINKLDSCISYLALCYHLKHCKHVLTSLAKEMIHTIPLIFGSADSCIQHFQPVLKTHNIEKVVSNAIYEQLEGLRQEIRDFMSPSLASKILQIDDLSSLDINHIIDNELTVAVRAATGAGKTKNIFGPIIKKAKMYGKKVVYISHLIALVEQVCLENQSISYKTHELCSIENAASLGVVINSIWKAHIRTFVESVDILIIDEFEKVLNAVVCAENSIQMDKKKVFECLSSIIKQIPLVIVGDADLSDLSLRYLQDIRGNTTLINCSKNPYSQIKAVVTDQNQYISTDRAKEQLMSDKVYLFDSLETLRRVTMMFGYKDKNGLDCEKAALNDGVLIVHGDNKNKSEQRAFLANPNEEIKKYSAVLASPCLGSGFSITTPFTNKVVVFCDKTLPPLELINFARRFRTANEIWFAVDAANDFNFRKYTPIDYKPSIHSSPTDKLEIEFTNTKTKFTSSLALNLQLTLEELGFIAKSEPSPLYKQLAARNQVCKVTKEYNEIVTTAVLSAPEISEQIYKRMRAGQERSASDNATLTRHQIQRDYLLNEVDESDVKFHFEFIKNKNIFDFFPFVHRTVRDKNSQKYQQVAMFIFENLLQSHSFSKDLAYISIHRDDVYKFAHSCYQNKDLLNWGLNEGLQIATLLQKNKATRYVRKLLKSLGFEINRFSGKTGKARVKLTSHALAYARL